jgi:predicted NAD-dependent protein-ADP-ribosyltransferase YbiA (DUF1768 family)
MTIYFYTTIDRYGCFSNFSRHGFELDGQYCPIVSRSISMFHLWNELFSP